MEMYGGSSVNVMNGGNYNPKKKMAAILGTIVFLWVFWKASQSVPATVAFILVGITLLYIVKKFLNLGS